MFKYKYRKHGDFEYEVFIECPCCHKVTSIVVDFEGFRKWLAWDTHVQDCFPTLGPDERELFITGLCLDCQKDLFSEDEP